MAVIIMAQACTVISGTTQAKSDAEYKKISTAHLSHSYYSIPKKILWVVDGEVYDSIESISEDEFKKCKTAKDLIEKVLTKNGVIFNKVKRFNILNNSDIARSVYPNYQDIDGAIIITTDKKE
ncbi:MAG: hypothetical protein IKW83_05865 [Muribaculaceae bacterium]|nr:hypothetical protein [Muribaculaceae bacterium]MBR5639275.1 hypothetical protein [Muribaculaceae bacterium]